MNTWEGLSPADAIAHLQVLLAMERREEEERDRQFLVDKPLSAQEADGVLLRHLTIANEEPGAGGQWLLTLKLGNNAPLPPFSARPGDPVGLGGKDVLADAHRNDAIRAVLTRVQSNAVELAVDPTDGRDLPSSPLAIWPIGTPVTYERSVAALSRALAAKGNPLAHLRDVLFAAKDPLPDAPPTPLPSLPQLNEAQQAAVLGALASQDVFLIHGPPGTGKTTTAAALARCVLERGGRVLMCAASNAGADQLALALLSSGGSPVRVGHPARVDVALHPCLLSERVRVHERSKLAYQLIRQAEQLRTRSKDSRKRFAEARAENRERTQEWRAMIADARKLMHQAEHDVLTKADAVACTLTGSGGPDLAGMTFDLCIIDEASQATVPQSLIPLHMAQRVVLVGDHKQLPPTVLSTDAAARGLATTLFDARQRDGKVRSAMLTTQHRMHQELMEFPSSRSYGGQLTAHPSVATRTLARVLAKEIAEPLAHPLLWLDTAGTGFSDEQPQGSTSYRNPGEARVCALVVRVLLDLGLAAGDVGVMAPYSAQVAALRTELAAEVGLGVEVDSVDAYQGREKEAVVVSLTRSNDFAEVGFVADARRVNVAITRARSCLVIVGDSATVAVRGEGAPLFEHAQRLGRYLSAYALEGFTP